MRGLYVFNEVDGHVHVTMDFSEPKGCICNILFLVWQNFKLRLTKFRLRRFEVYYVSVNETIFFLQNGSIHASNQFKERLLQDRSVACSFHRKYHLERLCKLAREMKSLLKCSFWYIQKYIQNISAARDFKDERALENYDVVKYQYKSCHWGKRHLRNYKSDNGYRLHQSNCFIDVKVGRVHDTIFRFINNQLYI